MPNVVYSASILRLSVECRTVRHLWADKDIMEGFWNIESEWHPFPWVGSLIITLGREIVGLEGK